MNLLGKRSKYPGAHVLVPLLLAFGHVAAPAADRALLIGIGTYDDDVTSLPGIDLDLDMMREVAGLLGFESTHIRALLDGEATHASIRDAIQNWLIKDVSPADRVLLYYSGHGTQLPDRDGDEPDGLDEALLSADSTVALEDGFEVARNFILDDELGIWLSDIPSQDVLVLLDACHSGTATKSFAFASRPVAAERGVSKFSPTVIRNGRPVAIAGAARKNTRGAMIEFAHASNYVAVGAAGDEELSIATPQGSIFTHGVREVVRTHAQSGAALTPAALAEAVTAFIHTLVPPDERFSPTVTGSERLASTPLRVARLEGGNGPVWQSLEAIVAEAEPMAISLVPKRNVLAVGEFVEIEVDLPAQGALNVIAIGADDVPRLLFPNALDTRNEVPGGAFRLPTAAMQDGVFKVRIQALAPTGPTMFVALSANGPLNLFESALGERDAEGVLRTNFGELSPGGIKALDEAQLRAGRVIVEVCETGPGCAADVAAGPAR